ncbi:tyrosine-type recombinase/integrase [Saccharopolyspora gloriosae]|uniref:Integrase n=1 Tax=Saccharopolyspora gloriosae TaxID=455344 RepID=A0A840NFU8_9PSEU|nr:site-specific integrase [Saccharopolyspora gloriosae]MBB5070464.1 integrase [Saccharopolyspora gloriosae]
MAWSEQRGPNSWRVRYEKDDGTLGSVNGFPKKKAADDYADSIKTDKRKGIWIDPSAGKLTLEEWSVDWLGALDVAANTESQYRSLLKHHILPRWGHTALSDITTSGVATWAKKVRARGYADATVSTMTKVLSMMLADATDDRLIPANPVRTRRRGQRRRTKRTERIWATPDQVVRVADNTAALVGPWAAALQITAAWTGARWGELCGLQRHNTHLDDAHVVIHPDNGALHEINGHFSLGPPKTAESARTITLPPFLVELLRHHLASHHSPFVFVTAENEHPRRSNFSRRAMRPAADGNQHLTDPTIPINPVKTGLTFHGFRHSHKTWLIEDNIPEIAQSRRLGHVLDDDIREAYSHSGPVLERRLIDALQQRWTTTITTTPINYLPSAWRAHTPPSLRVVS